MSRSFTAPWYSFRSVCRYALAREELRGRELVGVVRGYLGELGVPGRQLFLLRPGGRQGGVQLLHLQAEHVRGLVDRGAREVVLFLERVESVLVLVEVLL